MIRKASLLLAGAALGAIVAVTATQTRFFSGSEAIAASADLLGLPADMLDARCVSSVTIDFDFTISFTPFRFAMSRQIAFASSGPSAK